MTLRKQKQKKKEKKLISGNLITLKNILKKIFLNVFGKQKYF